MCRQKLIEIEGDIEKIDKIRINDYMIIDVIGLKFKKGFAPINCDLILDKIHMIGHIGFSLLYVLSSLFNKNFANPSEEFLKDVIKRDKNTVRTYLYLLQEEKLIKIFPQSPVLLCKDKNGNNVYQYVSNHYIVSSKLPGNDYYKKYYTKENNKQKINKEIIQKQILSQEELDEINVLKTIPYQEYLQTEHWRNKRYEALKRANHKCQLCGSKENLQVHHNTYDNRGNEKDEDLIVLCEICHGKFHDK